MSNQGAFHQRAGRTSSGGGRARTVAAAVGEASGPRDAVSSARTRRVFASRHGSRRCRKSIGAVGNYGCPGATRANPNGTRSGKGLTVQSIVPIRSPSARARRPPLGKGPPEVPAMLAKRPSIRPWGLERARSRASVLATAADSCPLAAVVARRYLPSRRPTVPPVPDLLSLRPRVRRGSPIETSLLLAFRKMRSYSRTPCDGSCEALGNESQLFPTLGCVADPGGPSCCCGRFRRRAATGARARQPYGSTCPIPCRRLRQRWRC